MTEDEEALGNSCTLNSIYNGVHNNIFIIVNSCTSAKEAQDTFDVSHEGTSKVLMSRLQLLTAKFENLMMKDDGTISKFNV